MASDRPVTFADRAVETLRRFEEGKARRPAYRAGAWDRVLARLIDFALLGAIAGIVVIGLLVAFGEEFGARNREVSRPPGSTYLYERTITWGPTAVSWQGAAAIAVGAGALVLYDVGTTALLGATPGKRILRMRVVRARDRARASLRRLAWRSALLAVPLAAWQLTWFSSMFYGWLSAGLVIVMFAWLRRDGAQTLYDRWAGTQVVRADSVD